MKKYTIDEYVRMSNAQLRRQINSVVFALLVLGVPEDLLEQFSLSAAEMTLRVKEGRIGNKHPKPLSPASPPLSPLGARGVKCLGNDKSQIKNQ